jgi:hypothetical protein
MDVGRKDLKSKVTDKAGGIAAQAQSKAGDLGLTRERAAEVAADVRDEVRVKGGKALDTTASGARQVVAGARRNKAQVGIATAVTAVIAALLAGWRIVRRSRRGGEPSVGGKAR